MGMPHEIRFELSDRIGGVDVSPASVPLGMLKQFAADVGRFLAGSRGEVDTSTVPVAIVEGSLAIVAPDLKDSLSVWSDIAVLQREDSLQLIDPLRADVLVEWQRQAKRNPSRRYAIADAATRVSIAISARSDFRHGGQEPWFRAERYVRGKVVDTGGKTISNLHLLLEDGTTLKIAATQQQLREEKDNYVYHDVIVRVSLEEHLQTGQRRNAHLLAFERKNEKFDAAAFDEFVRQGTAAWRDVGDPAAWVRDQRGH